MRGKRTSPEVVYAIMASYAITGNAKETALQLQLPIQTVSNIVRRNKDSPEFVKVGNEKRKEFSERASSIIDRMLDLLELRMQIASSDSEELAKLKLNEITTALGTLYDKRALAQGESTSNTRCTVELPPELDGYGI